MNLFASAADDCNATSMQHACVCLWNLETTTKEKKIMICCDDSCENKLVSFGCQCAVRF